MYYSISLNREYLQIANILFQVVISNYDKNIYQVFHIGHKYF
jgi:hypothetical protein